MNLQTLDDSPSLGDFQAVLKAARRSAVHLESRDSYGVADESGDFARWRSTGERDLDPGSDYWRPWVAGVRDAVARGVVMRRARIVSLPVSDYIRFEHAGTVVNVGAGEQVRWLPRAEAFDIALPGVADLWIFDGETVMFNLFTGDGDWADPPLKVSNDPQVAMLCRQAFESVWERGTPHERFVV